MKLKRLEISGFKSFRDKVVLDFASGVSGVVGPNGCGKSNVVDAIRWVMGEQRIKSLRGMKMEDVIFNGSQEAAPVGMAEISMSLSAEGIPFPDPYAACAELTVSRRLFRNGESEYIINGVSCRLLDVREFFLGTGVGARTYSIIEQNSVASLVEAKPEERRQFIEEAAGISKYKTRKEAAVRKLEATKQNIVRLNDILREVKGQLSALSRQARRAEQYRNLKGVIREDELAVSLNAYGLLKAEGEELRQQLHDCQRQEEAAGVSLENCEAGLAAARLEVATQESERSKDQEQLYQLRTALQVKEREIEFSKGKTADLSGRRERLGEELALLKTRREDLSREKEKISALQHILAEDVTRADGDIKEKEETITELKAALSAQQQCLEALKAQLIDVAAEKSRLNNNYSHFSRILEDLGRKQEKNLRDIDEHRQNMERLKTRLAGLGESLTADQEKLYVLRNRRSVAAEELQDACQSLQEVEETIDALKEELSNRSSRLASLKELHDGYALCNEAVRSIMMANKEKNLNGLAQDQVIGLVAEQLRVPQAYEAAVEAVLGDKLQYVIVKSHEAGVQAIDYLKGAAVGRSSFVPIVVRHVASGGAHGEHLREAVPLIERVEVADAFRGIAEYLLGDVLLIPDLRNGLSLWNRNGFRGTFVTPDGDMISPQGVLTGGRNGNGARSLLKSKREIETLTDRIGKLSASLKVEEERKRELTSLVAQGEEDRDSLTADIHALELQWNSNKKDVERYEEELKRLHQTMQIIEFNGESMEADRLQTLQKIKDYRAELEVQKKREETVQDAVSALQDKVVQLRGEMETMDRELTADKVRQAALAEKRKAAAKSWELLQSEAAVLEEKIRKGSEDQRLWHDEIEDLQVKIDREEAELAHLYDSLGQMEQILAVKRDVYVRAESSLRDCESKLQESKGQLDKIVKEGRNLESCERETSYRIGSLIRMCEEKHGAALAELPEPPRHLDEEEVKAIQARIEKNRQSLAVFGEVNLLAINEHDELRDRFDFMTAQSRDLDASLQTLQQTIAKINRVSRQRFAETFDAVRGCFRDVFSRIFPGGKGELYLTDESDLLETGVDIAIQIPGKRPQNLSLLSGGEKSLAAIALILAIILYRPTPFLVLDEVDAALDDANISLFAKIIKEIAVSSQVILITHNKKTMEAAENLFGVTMQKQGISTVVSVSLN